MAPIRIGFIGLSASGGWASSAHIAYLQQTSKYTITALCNSSVAAAETAIKHFKLDSKTKAYGSPADLAKDPDVDLVVCTTRVDKHYECVKPALEAGKNVYCEWPLGANLVQAEELAGLAAQKGVRTMVGLQARRSPVVNKIKELIAAGSIGRVLSSTVTSSAGNFGPTESVRTKYFTQRVVGGNMMSIHFGHLIDFVLYVLGELSSFSGLVSIQRPQVDILDKDSNKVETVTKDTHDQIMLQGKLDAGGVLAVHQRGGSPFKDLPGLTWRIYGDKGEIMVTSDGSFLQVGYPNMNIKLHDFAKNTVQDIDWSWPDAARDLSLPGKNVAMLYEAYAAGNTNEYVEWDEAVARHRLLEELYKSSSAPSNVSSSI